MPLLKACLSDGEEILISYPSLIAHTHIKTSELCHRLVSGTSVSSFLRSKSKLYTASVEMTTQDPENHSQTGWDYRSTAIRNSHTRSVPVQIADTAPNPKLHGGLRNLARRIRRGDFIYQLSMIGTVAPHTRLAYSLMR